MSQDLSVLLSPLTNIELVRIIIELSNLYPGITDYIKDKLIPARRKLFIRNLGPTTTSENVRQAFLKHGQIEEAVVIHDPATQRSKQYAFVMYKDLESTNRALLDKFVVINGRIAEVSIALNKESNQVRIITANSNSNNPLTPGSISTSRSTITNRSSSPIVSPHSSMPNYVNDQRGMQYSQNMIENIRITDPYRCPPSISGLNMNNNDGSPSLNNNNSNNVSLNSFHSFQMAASGLSNYSSSPTMHNQQIFSNPLTNPAAMRILDASNSGPYHNSHSMSRDMSRDTQFNNTNPHNRPDAYRSVPALAEPNWPQVYPVNDPIYESRDSKHNY